MHTTCLKPDARNEIRYALRRLGFTYIETNIKLSVLATRIANQLEYAALLREQGEFIFDWHYFGSGLNPHSTVRRWRSGSSVRIETHYALCLAVIYLTGWNSTVEDLTAPPLEPIIRYRNTNDALQQMLENYRCLTYYPREVS